MRSREARRSSGKAWRPFLRPASRGLFEVVEGWFGSGVYGDMEISEHVIALSCKFARTVSGDSFVLGS